MGIRPLRRPSRTRLLCSALLLGTFAAAILPACSSTSTREAVSGEPVILFAVDGLEWRVLDPLIEEGRLPVMAGLMKRGVFGRLESMVPTYSAVIWTSIATGKVPSQHGIRHFVYETNQGGRREYRYYTSGHRETKAFWNILSDYDLKVHCIGWWMTYPAEKINGTMVSQTNTTSVLHDPQRALWKGSLLRGVENQVHPLDYQNKVMSILEETENSMDRLTESIFGTRPHPSTEFSRLMWDQTLWAFRADATYIEVARDILRSGEPFDLLSVYVGGPDVAAHRFWRYAHPEEFTNPPSREQIDNYGNIIDDYYAYVDRVLGEIIQAAPDSATVIIVSDHGMHAINNERIFSPEDPPQYTNSAHHLDAPPGVFIAAGAHIRSARRAGAGARVKPGVTPVVGGVLDIAPTLLALKGIPLGEDLDGQLLRGVVETAWLEDHPIRYLRTHDTSEWQAARQERIREAVAQSERLEQLRSLGYIR